jgi:hypothetical protein
MEVYGQLKALGTLATKKRAPCTHWMGSLVILKAYLYIVEKNNLYPFRESTVSPFALPVA